MVGLWFGRQQLSRQIATIRKRVQMGMALPIFAAVRHFMARL
jgi:hypothetical protein